MIKQYLTYMLAGVICCLAACSSGPTEQDAMRLASAYYYALQGGDVDDALRTLGGEQEPEAWRHFLDQRLAQRGRPQSYDLRKVETNTVYSGVFYIMEFDVLYSGGKRRETLTLGEPVMDGELKIVSVRDEE